MKTPEFIVYLGLIKIFIQNRKVEDSDSSVQFSHFNSAVAQNPFS